MRKLLLILFCAAGAAPALAVGPTCKMDVLPEIVQPGHPVTLAWVTSDAYAAVREDSTHVDLEGRATIRPTTTRVYSLWVEGADGIGYCEAEVTVTR